MPKLSFITWFSTDVRSAVAFYRQLGIFFAEEQHGDGPVHFAFQADNLSVELYPAKAGTTPSGEGTLIGFEIADVDVAISIAQSNGLHILEPVKTTPMGERIILRDPDGRQVFLFSSHETRKS